MLPDKDIVVIPYKAEMAYLYNDSRLMRNTVMIGGIITLLIALIGLIGYVRDETNRRSKEIAIRKVNGARQRKLSRSFRGRSDISPFPPRCSAPGSPTWQGKAGSNSTRKKHAVTVDVPRRHPFHYTDHICLRHTAVLAYRNRKPGQSDQIGITNRLL